MSETVGNAGAGAAGAAGTCRDADAARQSAGSHARIAWLVALLLGFGFAGALASLGTQSRAGASFDMRGWRDGSLGRNLDRALDVPYARTLQRWQAAARYGMLGDLGHQVREGCPGWLFYADGVRAPVQPGDDAPVHADGGDALTDARIATMRGYANALRGMGIQLLVVTVPDKARVESEALCGLRQDARLTQRLAAWQRALSASGVAQVGLLPVLQAARPAFFRTDVHWNARGAQAAAQAVGAAVLPMLGARGETVFTHMTAPAAPRVGDLLKLANLDDVPDAWRPAPDIVAAQTLRAQRSGGLLDDGPAAEVLLAGSSFSRRSAFAERLGEQLGREVWNVSLDDGQFDRAMQSAWRERANWPKSVRVVIWEMSEDALSMHVDAPVDAPFDAHAAAAGARSTPHAGGQD
ncbi:cell division protein FtsQ [Paraburkholderia sp. LEh10]|uniref:alginate O-acetyltransferase AlgX-related protein n=1 Tax=Paraburkholderia sp. LEh10 TaxID=2821353 RepID=UPI001AE4B7D9|nr:cell division protein FtsQ [Paraburkholderia sp. LEh10]MBP0594378.1 cell division protein FtsQ [Paraburkholderia sp. LEh10]